MQRLVKCFCPYVLEGDLENIEVVEGYGVAGPPLSWEGVDFLLETIRV